MPDHLWLRFGATPPAAVDIPPVIELAEALSA
jgi:hypothetical protein